MTHVLGLFPQALDGEVAKWERLLGPPLSHGLGASSPPGAPGLARGWRASPTPSVGAPRGLTSGAPVGASSSADASSLKSPGRPRGPTVSQEGPLGPLGSLEHPARRDDFVTSVGGPESCMQLGTPMGAFESPTHPARSSIEKADLLGAQPLPPAGVQQEGPTQYSAGPGAAEERAPAGGPGSPALGLESVIAAVRKARSACEGQPGRRGP